MISRDKVSEIICIIDEFCKFFEAENVEKLLITSDDRRRRRRSASMSDSEIMTRMESQMPERIADARYHKRIITISKELDFPNHLGNPYDGCLSLDIRLTVFLSAF